MNGNSEKLAISIGFFIGEDKMTPREELTKFYESLKARAPSNLNEYADISGPDLIWLDDEYLNSSPRIAIVGQQQYGWDYDYPEFISDWNIADAMKIYQDFDFGLKYPATPFWQFFHTVRLSAFPTEPDARRKVLWTNLVKFVAGDSSPILSNEAALKLQDDIFATELKIAKPNICLFVTGPDYDVILDRYFPGIQFQPIDGPERQFAKLVHPNLPQHSYRCYHPKYLSFDRPNRWDKVLQILSTELSWPSLPV